MIPAYVFSINCAVPLSSTVQSLPSTDAAQSKRNPLGKPRYSSVRYGRIKPDSHADNATVDPGFNRIPSKIDSRVKLPFARTKCESRGDREMKRPWQAKWTKSASIANADTAWVVAMFPFSIVAALNNPFIAATSASAPGRVPSGFVTATNFRAPEERRDCIIHCFNTLQLVAYTTSY